MKYKQIKVNASAYGRLIELMLDGTLSCRELAEETGLHYLTVLDYTRALHKASAAHISSWEKDAKGRDCIRIYKIGRGKDAKRTKISAADRAKAYREKLQGRKICHILAGQATSVI